MISVRTRYVVNICGDLSYAVFFGALFVITVIYGILEKIMKISLISNIRTYDKIFLISWIFTSIMLMIPLLFYFDGDFLKCSNWNEHHKNDGENILPSSDENTWSMGATLWMCIGSFCQIWLIGFCGCTFNKGIQYDAKNFGVSPTDNDDENRLKNIEDYSLKLHSLRVSSTDYSQGDQT